MSKSSNGTANLLDLITPEQRSKLAGEVLGGKFHEIFASAVEDKMTLGSFVESLQGEDFWDDMATFPLSKMLKSTARKPRAAKTPLDDATIKTVLAYVRKNPGLTVNKIAEGGGVDKNLVRKVLEQAKKDKTVKTDGKKRNTTYAVA